MDNKLYNKCCIIWSEAIMLILEALLQDPCLRTAPSYGRRELASNLSRLEKDAVDVVVIYRSILLEKERSVEK